MIREPCSTAAIAGWTHPLQEKVPTANSSPAAPTAWQANFNARIECLGRRIFAAASAYKAGVNGGV
jgi:hypothetical protein